jgi:hypothetical protein
MLSRLKHYLFIGVALAILYGLLSYHFVFFSFTSFDMLKKDPLTLRYTFYNMAEKSPETVLKIDALRHDGIGDLMVARGLLSEERLDQILRKIDANQ